MAITTTNYGWSVPSAGDDRGDSELLMTAAIVQADGSLFTVASALATLTSSVTALSAAVTALTARVTALEAGGGGGGGGGPIFTWDGAVDTDLSAWEGYTYGVSNFTYTSGQAVGTSGGYLGHVLGPTAMPASGIMSFLLHFTVDPSQGTAKVSMETVDDDYTLAQLMMFDNSGTPTGTQWLFTHGGTEVDGPQYTVDYTVDHAYEFIFDLPNKRILWYTDDVLIDVVTNPGTFEAFMFPAQLWLYNGIQLTSVSVADSVQGAITLP